MTRRVVVIGLVLATLGVVAAAPTSAGAADSWGFVVASGSGYPGGIIVANLTSAADHASGDPDRTFDACDRAPDYRFELMDRLGRVVTSSATPGPLTVPADTVPSAYVMRVSCTVFGDHASACAALPVLAAGTLPPRGPRGRDDTLVSDPCPGEDVWGFANIEPGGAPPGTYVIGALWPQAWWDTPYDPATEALPLDVETCGDTAQWELLDSTGRRVAAQGVATSDTAIELPGHGVSLYRAGATLPIQVPDTATPGTYALRQRCTENGRVHSVCARFEVTAAGTAVGANRTVPRGSPLISERCPLSLRDVVSDSVLGVRALFASLGRRLFPLPVIPTETTTTTTTRPASSSGGSQGGGTPASGPAPDTTLPVVSVGIISKTPNGCFPATVPWTATDNVGIASVTVSWTGPSNGSVAATQSPTNVNVSPSGLYVFKVEARDAAGNVGAATRQFSC